MIEFKEFPDHAGYQKGDYEVYKSDMRIGSIRNKEFVKCDGFVCQEEDYKEIEWFLI